MLLIISLSKNKLKKRDPLLFINKFKEQIIISDNYNEDPVIS